MNVMRLVRIAATITAVLLLTAMSCNGGSVNADLTVSAIGVPSVECPTGAGSCVTTVDVTVENLGTDAAGSFTVKVTFDPSQSVTVDETVAGLSAGATTTFTVSTPAGGNCFDPDCTVSVEVDDGDDVSETNEDNNEDSRTVLG